MLVLTLTTQERTPPINRQVTAGTLVCAIPKKVVVAWLTKAQAVLCQALADTAAIFLKPGMSPVDGQRIRIQRIVDYYHASLRLTTIADALLLTSSQRTEWLKRVRKLLLELGGWGRVMRSIAGMEQQHGVEPANS